MPEAQTRQRSRTRTPQGDDETVRIEIDPDETDPSKAVARVKDDEALSLSGEDGDSKEDAQFKRYDQRMSRSIQKRMARLSRNLTHSFEQQRAEDEARHQREIAALRRGDGRLDVDRGDTTDSAHEAEMVALQTQLELASEKGDSKEVARITRVMSQKDAQYWAAKQAKVSLADTPRTPQARARKDASTPAEDPRLTDEAKKWIKANAEWWDDDDYRAERQVALVIDEDLNDEGFDRNEPEYFQELSKRLKGKFPGMKIAGVPRRRTTNGNGHERHEDGEEGEFRSERVPLMSHEDRGSAPTRQRGRRVSLTREQIATMRAMKMDPDNNEDVLTFWEESQALAAQEDD